MAQTSRISNTGTYFTVNGMFDEFTGAPVVDSSLQFWLDAGQTSSYSGTGTTWTDLSVGGNVGTISGATFNTVSGGGAFVFDGSNDIVTIPNKVSLDTQTPSVEVWVKTNATNQNGFWFEKGFVNTQYSLFQEGGNIRWRMYIGGITQLSTTTATYMNTEGWYQVVGTYTSGSRKLYINGVLVNSDAQTGTINTDTNGMSIGAYGGTSGTTGYFYNGSLAICRVYNKVLSQEEVVQNYNANCGRFGLPSITSTQMPVIKRETSNAVILTNGYFDEFTGAPVVDANLIVRLDVGQSTSYTGTGTTWTNLANVSANTTLVNSPAFNTQGWLAFNGTNQTANTGLPGATTFTTDSSFTISCWARFSAYKPAAASIGTLVGALAYQGYGLYWSGSPTSYTFGSYMRYSSVSSSVTSAAVSPGTWYLVTQVYSRTGNFHRLYLNGVLSGSTTTISGTFNTNLNNVFISIAGGTAGVSDGTPGGGTAGTPFLGDISQVLIYNRALSAADITQNYNAGCQRYGLSPDTATQMPVVKRETSTGIILVNGIFDEYTGLLSPGLFKTTYAGYFSDNVSFFASATPTTYGTNPATSVQTSVITDASSDDGSNFSCQWLGYFIPSTTETHTFYLTSDDASYLWLGDTAITGFTTANSLVNNGGLHGNVEANGSITLTSGTKYPIRIQFGEAGGGDVMILSYATPTITKSSNVIGKVFYNELTSGI